MRRHSLLVVGLLAGALAAAPALSGCIVVDPNPQGSGGQPPITTLGKDNPGTSGTYRPGTSGGAPVGGDELTDADKADIFVMGILDAHYYGGASAEYMELFNIDGESITAGYDYSVAAGVNDLVCYFGLDIDEASFEGSIPLRELVQDLYAEALYVTDSVTKTADGHTVRLAVFPLDVFGLVGSGTMMDLHMQYQADASALGAQAAQDKLFAGCVQAVRDVMGRMEYLDAVYIDVPVGKDHSGRMTIFDELVLDEIRTTILKTEYPDAG